MKLTIELEREVDGRWIAEVRELNVLLYGKTKAEAIRKAEDAAREIVAAPPVSKDPATKG